MKKSGLKIKKTKFVVGLMGCFLSGSLCAIVTTESYLNLPEKPAPQAGTLDRFSLTRADVLRLGATFPDALIHNLRFLACVTPTIDEKGSRTYAADQGLNAIGKLLCLLFPSPAGTLNTQSGATSNFGKDATPQTMKHLFDYIDDLGYRKTQSQRQSQTIDCGFFSSKRDNNALKSTKKSGEVVGSNIFMPRRRS